MQESNSGTAGTDTGLLVDQFDPFFLQFRQGGIDVFDAKGDMLDAGPPFFYVFCHRSIRRGGFQKLHFTFTDRKKGGGHFLFSHGLGPLEFKPQDIRPEFLAFVDAVHRYAKMIDLQYFHAKRSSLTYIYKYIKLQNCLLNSFLNKQCRCH